MLQQLAQRDSDWRKMAFKITKDKELADDIVEKEITFYVIEHVRYNSDQNCTIVSGGFEYLVNETYDSVNAKIAERMTFKFT